MLYVRTGTTRTSRLWCHSFIRTFAGRYRRCGIAHLKQAAELRTCGRCGSFTTCTSISCTRSTAISLSTSAINSRLWSSTGSKLGCTIHTKGPQMCIACLVSGKTTMPCVPVSLSDCTGTDLTFQPIADIRIFQLYRLLLSLPRERNQLSLLITESHTCSVMHALNSVIWHCVIIIIVVVVVINPVWRSTRFRY